VTFTDVAKSIEEQRTSPMYRLIPECFLRSFCLRQKTYLPWFHSFGAVSKGRVLK
jgi:hypothetical protein